YKVGNSTEFKMALAVVQGGDTILLKDGEYDQGPYTLQRGGSEDSPITIRAENTHGALIRGHHKPTKDSDKRDCLVIRRSPQGEITQGRLSWVSVEGLRFENCWSAAVYTNGVSFVSFLNNHIIGSSIAFRIDKQYLYES